MATRRRERQVALQMLFQWDASDCPPDQVPTLYKTCFSEGSSPDGFSIRLFTTVTQRLNDIDGIIEASSDNWRLNRMSLVDRNILRIGAGEILFNEDIPTRVAINEAVELAKRFGTAESPAFVNGILDRVARDKEKI
ncbi:MAG: transcription antitermination factor NusB [Myxococcota bacterium]|nr:transcription antitermination factor NusB [Myxococcota bacterium]